MKIHCITGTAKTIRGIVARKKKEGFKSKGKPLSIGGGFLVQPMTKQGE